MLTLPSLVEQRALIAATAPERLRSFRAASRGDRRAIELYVLDAELSSMMHATIRGLEVLLRERMHRALTAAYGSDWYITQRALLDRRTKDKIKSARDTVGHTAPDGKVVAQLMFGAWVNLLDSGGALTNAPTSPLADYDRDLWAPALSSAFTGPRGGPVARSDVHALVQTVHWARNRVNHCEPVVFGFPQPGQQAGGGQLRKTPERVMKDARQVLRLLDADVAVWMSRWNAIDRIIRDPVAQSALARPPAGVTLQH